MTETEAASLKRSLPKKSPLLDDEEIDEFDNAPRKAGIERKGDGAGKATDSKAAGAAAKGDSKSGDSKQSSEKRVPRVKGGGITHAAFRLAATRGLDLLGLVMFSNEGDNSGDGVLMAALVDAVTNTAQGTCCFSRSSSPATVLLLTRPCTPPFVCCRRVRTCRQGVARARLLVSRVWVAR